MALPTILRPLFTGLFLLCLAWGLQGQSVSTRPALGAKAQIILHLDQLERSWPVQEARKEQSRKGSAPGVETEAIVPGDMQMSLQLKAIQGDMQFELYPGVRDFVLLYAKRKRAATEAVMGLQEVYFPEIEKQLKERDMPENLKYLPAALSALNTRAIAEHGATGLWQMPFHAAIRHGLICDDKVDERRDPAKATRAALDYLDVLHTQYGDWTMAMTAFICGPGGLQRASNRAGHSRDFEKLYPYLPESGRDYLPAFMAAAYVMQYHKLFGLQALEFRDPHRKDVLQLPEPVTFAPVAKILNLPEEQLWAYNPVCRTAVIPFTGSTVQICLPAGYGARFSQLKDSIYAMQHRLEVEKKVEVKTPEIEDEPLRREKPVVVEPPANTEPVRYTIERGDNLGAISRWFGVKLSDLKAWNGLTGDNIKAGDALIIHVPKNEVARFRKVAGMSYAEKEAMNGQESHPKPPAPETRPTVSQKSPVYVVKQGDSLWAISQKYPGVSAEDIMRANGITEDIQPGMKLKIPTPNQ